jgi:hypothetical protein
MTNRKLSLQQAQQIAQVAINRIISTAAAYASCQFNPASLQYETDVYWTFAAASQELRQQGIVPGAIHVCVDKRDGHIWSSEELDRFYDQQGAAASPVARVA